MIPRGVGLFIAPDVWVRTDGTVFVKSSTRGLADNVSETDWTEWGKLGSGILDNILKYKIASKQISYGQSPSYQLPIGSAAPVNPNVVAASGPGFAGQINPIYLLLGAGLLMFAMRK